MRGVLSLAPRPLFPNQLYSRAFATVKLACTIDRVHATFSDRRVRRREITRFREGDRERGELGEEPDETVREQSSVLSVR